MTNKLAAMAKVMNGKAVLPILSTFLLELKDGVVEVTASDLECMWHGSVPVTGQEGEGKVCILVSTLLDALKNLPEQPVTFIIDDEDKSVCIEYLNGHYDMVWFPADEYPQTECQGDIRFHLEASAISKAIEQSLYAVSIDTLHPVMTGICFTLADGKMECAASDGYKLVRNVYPLAKDVENCHFLLSSKAAKIIKGLLQKQEAAWK